MIWTDMFRKICMDVAQLSALQGAGGWLYRFDLAPSLPENQAPRCYALFRNGLHIQCVW